MLPEKKIGRRRCSSFTTEIRQASRWRFDDLQICNLYTITTVKVGRRRFVAIRSCNRNSSASLLAVKPRVVSVTGAPVSHYRERQTEKGRREGDERENGGLWRERVRSQ
ncbi:hypothetical protein TIFTF001_025878 [Ficus carica]|uniref:Uncharacterized protein n=1 Tax=Ficus carica TaxID=3494 RepID=A0AA88AKM3_FICCA|nr:hypothetical protein TIFTF001_025878 [Ficus carica]